MAPASERNRDYTPHVRIERDDLGEGLLGDPIDRELRPVPSHVGNQRERVDDIAQRGRPNHEKGIHLCAPTLSAFAAALPPERRPREQGEAKARRVRLRARVAVDLTTQHVGHDVAEAAAIRFRGCPAPLIEATT